MTPYWSNGHGSLYCGDVLDRLRALPDGSCHCAITSPPYWGLRDYGVDGQIGLESTPEGWVGKMVEVFREVRRVLRDDGTCWLNVGDSYAQNELRNRNGNTEFRNRPVQAAAVNQTGKRLEHGLKPKDLCLMPFRLALALQADGWWVRSDICWYKKSPMPESVTDRPTSAWEHIFLLSKSAKYYYDADAVREAYSRDPTTFGNSNRTRYGDDGTKLYKGRKDGLMGEKYANDAAVNPTGRNQRNVWHLGPEPYPDAHFATFPTEIPRMAIKAGTSDRGCCAECGAPWERVVEKQHPPTRGTESKGPYGGHGLLGGKRFDEPILTTTTGWSPTCACDADVVPCTVLDPFMGSGTTAAVAQELDRRWIGVELNPAYCDLAMRRIQAAGSPQIALGL